MTSVETASTLDLLLFTTFLLAVAAGVWWFAGFWGRMWHESLESRTVDRRFLRWQRFAFRGHYPFGHWGSASSRAHLKGIVFFVRAFVVLVLLVYFVAVGRRILADLSAAHDSRDRSSITSLVAGASVRGA